MFEMENLYKLVEPILEENYEEFIEILEQNDLNYPKSSSFDASEMSSEEIGRVMTYLARNEVIDFYSERKCGASTYDLTGIELNEVRDFLNEEFDLD